jgi:hypothetical protein
VVSTTSCSKRVSSRSLEILFASAAAVADVEQTNDNCQTRIVALERELSQMRAALAFALNEVEAGEADSENEHAGCLRRAGERLRAVLET